MTTITSSTALRAEDFVQSIGVVAHLEATTSSYGNVAAVQSQLAYIGVDHVRAYAPGTNATLLATEKTLGAAGIKFDMLVMGNLPQAMTSIDALAAYVVSVEGPNEVNVTPPSYNGLTGTAAAIALQEALYTAVHADPLLNNATHSTPVLNFTVSLGGNPNYALYGNMSAYADYTNVHAYGQYGIPSAWFVPAEIAGVTDTPNLPVIVTETGNYTMLDGNSGVSQAVQAKLIMNTLLDDFKNGVSTTYLYQLEDGVADPNNTNSEDHYGLFNADGTPKTAAIALHDLTTILSDTGATAQTFAAAPLTYSVSGLPASGSQMLLEKSNGAYDITLWQEPLIWNYATNSEIAITPTTVTVTLGRVYQTVNIYDPLQGTTPIATYHNVSSVQVPLGSSAMVVEVEPDSAASSHLINTGTAGGAFVTTAADTVTTGSGAASISGGASAITGSTGSLVVNLTGSGTMVTGGSGSLTVTSSTGKNTITGGAGAFTYTDLAGNDLITLGSSSKNQLKLGTGRDTIIAGSGAATIAGSTAATTITGGSGALTVSLVGSQNSITGGAGSLTITDAIGGNTITGGTGALTLSVKAGNDVITTHNTTGVSAINLGTGAATIVANGAVSINGGMGSINFIGTTGDEFIFTQANTKNLLALGNGSNTVLSHGADTITVGVGATRIYAMGATSITGGAGTLNVSATGSGVTIKGGTGTVLANSSSNFSFIQGGTNGGNVLNVSGGNSTLVGGGSGDKLSSTGSGNNLLQASSGSTTLTSGTGNDTLVGGSGADVFVFTKAAAFHSEIVQNFTAGVDKLSFLGFGSVSPISSQQVIGGNLQLTLADQSQVTLLNVTKLT